MAGRSIQRPKGEKNVAKMRSHWFIFVLANHQQKHDNYEQRLKSENFDQAHEKFGQKMSRVFQLAVFFFQGA